MILITGSNGFLGSYIYNFLKESDIKTLNRSNSDYNCDLSLDIPILNNKFDLVIHSAGLAHITINSIKASRIFFDINVNGTKNLLKSLSIYGPPKKFVFISSVSVYGLTKVNNINEEYPLNANDPYGKSKVESELIVKEWCKQHNIICTILRLPLVVGVRPPGNLMTMINGINKGYFFNIAGGNVKKSMVLASDIAKYIIIASEFGGTYNLTDGIHPTFKKLSLYIGKKLGKYFIPNLPLIVAQILSKVGDLLGDNFPFNSNKLLKIISPLTFDDSKARLIFGWDPTPVLENFNLFEDD